MPIYADLCNGYYAKYTVYKRYSNLCLVSDKICNQQVVGSSPTNGSKTKTLENIAFQGFFFFSLETSNRAKIAKMVTIW